MSDETNYGTNAPGNTEAPAGTAGTAERVGFCQDCGTPLTRETARPVGTGVFCEPCLAARVGSTTSNQQGYTTVQPVGAVPPAGAVPPMGAIPTSLPHPVLAGFLGLIPGVGAMYNGQYAKGVAHLVVFVVLASLNDHVNGIFGLLVAGWVFYQVFDAYHTAKARLEGRPLPNPFGLNDIGERMGFGRQPGTAGAAAAGAGAAAPPPAGPAWTGEPVNAGPTTYSAPHGTAGYTAPAGYAPPTSGPDWVGYVPPVHFASAPNAGAWSTPEQYAATMADDIRAQAMRDAGVPTTPYTPTYSGSAQPYAATPVPVTKRFPVGAIWLIGLGVVFLLFEFGQEWGWSLNFNWVLALLFASLAALILVRRLHAGVPVMSILRAPVAMAVLALLFLLQALDVASLGRTWPILFIVFGAVLILERTSLANAAYGVPVYPAGGSVVPPMNEADAERTRAAWAASNPTESQAADLANTPKGGQ
ncbi:hypothetical protein GOB94_11170 [Granulicella sp. 5B5]|uniref:hypothetical protein n=1 Tax=Granulicella sp. 5B5 TaxID=1617967 RepID=UPI0015F55746|nr:hypothetical protein [Granulicella sp. 5B5]QMV19170.1 hypothetical protein GOB94_11170 [Granulicella sp. 5B5]